MPLRIKHAVFAFLPCLGLALPVVSQAASEPRYTYGELGYINADYDDISEDGDGFAIGGSYALTKDIHVVADYSDIDLDNGDASTLSFGIGVNFPLRPGLDAVGRARYIDAEVDRPGDNDESGFGLEAGVRTMINSQLELNGGVRYTDVFDDNTSIAIGALYDVVPNFALGGEFEYSDDYTALVLKARLYFNPPRQLR
jgi:opacity protein-like surface antigen